MAIMKNTMKAGKIVKQAIQLQASLRKLKKALAKRKYQATAGEVTVTITGSHRINQIDVATQSLTDTPDVQRMLREIQEATNKAIAEAEIEAKREMKAITKGSPAEAMLSED